jgi:hypothetical protein
MSITVFWDVTPCSLIYGYIQYHISEYRNLHFMTSSVVILLILSCFNHILTFVNLFALRSTSSRSLVTLCGVIPFHVGNVTPCLCGNFSYLCAMCVASKYVNISGYVVGYNLYKTERRLLHL